MSASTTIILPPRIERIQQPDTANRSSVTNLTDHVHTLIQECSAKQKKETMIATAIAVCAVATTIAFTVALGGLLLGPTGYLLGVLLIATIGAVAAPKSIYDRYAYKKKLLNTPEFVDFATQYKAQISMQHLNSLVNLWDRRQLALANKNYLTRIAEGIPLQNINKELEKLTSSPKL
jgi:hypothetical protein